MHNSTMAVGICTHPARRSGPLPGLWIAVLAALSMGSAGLAAAATGSLKATLDAPVVAVGGLGSTTLTWSSAGTPTAEVWVSLDGLPEALMASSPAGSASPPWIQGGHDYRFTLYAGNRHTVALSSVVVIGVAAGGGNLAVDASAIEAARGGVGTAGVRWACAGPATAEVWVSTDGAAEALFARAQAGNQAAPWIQPGHSYQFKLYSGTTHTTLLDSAWVWGDLDYKVGVDYHATGSDFVNTALVTRYDQPGVRDTVRAQLQGMADRGATLIHTRLWMVSSPTDAEVGEAWRCHFPLSKNESDNLRAYAQDLAAVQAADGHRLRLDLTLLWLGAADYQRGSPGSGLGYDNLLPAEFQSRVEQTIASVVAAVQDVYRPDARRLVDTINLDGEVMIGAKANQEWFLSTLYPGFIRAVQAGGMNASLYFLADGAEAAVLDNGFVDGTYPVLNGHRSMYWIYRSLRFLADHGLPLPPRVDFSCYPGPTHASYATLIQRIFDDADATLPTLGLARKYGAAETLYPLLKAERVALGQAFAAQRLLGRRLERVQFWTAPDGGGAGIPVGYPFAVEDYLP